MYVADINLLDLSLDVTHLKVLFDFVLEETRVFFQGLLEVRDTLVDVQQLHWVTIMVPRRRNVLQHTRRAKTTMRTSDIAFF